MVDTCCNTALVKIFQNDRMKNNEETPHTLHENYAQRTEH